MTLRAPRITVSVEKTGEYQGHRDAIYTMAKGFALDSFLSAGAEGLVAEWDPKTKNAQAIAQTETSIYSLATLHFPDLLIIGRSDGVIQWVDPKAKTTLKTVKSHDKGVFDLLVLPEQNLMFSSGEDGYIISWDLKGMDPIKKARIADKSIRTILFDPISQTLFAGSSTNKIYHLDLELNLLNSWDSHFLSVFRIRQHPESRNIVSVGRDAHIREWNASEGWKEERAIPAHMYAINDLVFHPGKPFFFTGSMDKSIKIWDQRTFELLKVVDHQRNECHRNGVNRLLFTNGSLYSCGDDRLIMEWRINFSDPQ